MIKYVPGYEPDEIKIQLQDLFRNIRAEFPDGVIYADKWNHEWDNLAGRLCRALGYTKGLYLLTVYGFTVKYELPQNADTKAAVYTGKIVKMLMHGKSGFIACNEDGKEYYFNVRDFEGGDSIPMEGCCVRFTLEDRFDRKKNVRKPSAVNIEYIAPADT